MSAAIAIIQSDLIEHYYLAQHMSYQHVAAKVGISEYQVKRYLTDKGLSRTRKQATSKAARTMRLKAANQAFSHYDIQEQREARGFTKAIELVHQRAYR
ncbi:hypothetical protein ORI98_03500 [Shewanella sp. ULN5]|uniref:hypothetical protein n=1 Tax=Shewanella sp. ULN5 TaxID=2994678 RepID=UPI00273F7074|nr:hypothetical protein [Shewanella sp. ULN5]MDP5145504.1 hypothetical protein [Shewanella sp. ULN5]